MEEKPPCNLQIFTERQTNFVHRRRHLKAWSLHWTTGESRGLRIAQPDGREIKKLDFLGCYLLPGLQNKRCHVRSALHATSGFCYEKECFSNLVRGPHLLSRPIDLPFAFCICRPIPSGAAPTKKRRGSEAEGALDPMDPSSYSDAPRGGW